MATPGAAVTQTQTAAKDRKDAYDAEQQRAKEQRLGSRPKGKRVDKILAATSTYGELSRTARRIVQHREKWVSTAKGSDEWRRKQSDIGVGPRVPFPGLYQLGWWNESMGLDLAEGDPIHWRNRRTAA